MTILTSLKVVLISSEKVREQMSAGPKVYNVSNINTD